MRSLNLQPDKDGHVWVFGYGSLMWNPGFAHHERAAAVLTGYRRRLCVYSYNHRGTADRPGLVMGLDRGGACKGAVYRADPEFLALTTGYLAERELIYPVYQPRRVPVRLASGPGAGQRVLANVFICDRTHPDYAGHLTQTEAADIVASAVGDRGEALDYLASAVDALEQAGVPDRHLEALLEEAKNKRQQAA